MKMKASHNLDYERRVHNYNNNLFGRELFNELGIDFVGGD